MPVTTDGQVTGVLVIDGFATNVGVLSEVVTGVLVFDGDPVSRPLYGQQFPGALVVSTTGRPGAAGQSAYELAVAHGFEGTEQEYLDTLRGFILVEPGADPPVGTPDRTFVFERVP